VDAERLGPWTRELDGADVVVNLAGRSVNCRYTVENRRAIKDSRVNSTRVVGEAIAGAARPPRLWLQMSTAHHLRHRYDAPNDETTGVIGGAEPGAPDTWPLQHRRGDVVGARVGSGDAAHPQGGAAHGRRDEPRPGRRLRPPAAPGALRPRRPAATAGSTSRGSTTATSCAPSTG